jgi:uncharacterized protein (UPF0248 family)
MIFNRRYSVSILDEKWVPIKNKIRVKHVPRADELIHIDGDDNTPYYRVINVIHYLSNKRQGIFIIVKPMLLEEPNNQVE